MASAGGIGTAGGGPGRVAPHPARMPFARLARNDRGRDFLVGDVHGCFDLVLRAMDAARFDTACDRVLAVGDLVDRGPHSHRALRFLAMPWVRCVRGNHEDMVLRLAAGPEPEPAAALHMARELGIGWWFRAPDSLRSDMVAAFEALPIAMQVDTRSGPLGIVHADVPRGMGWAAFVAAVEARDPSVTREALWGRTRIRESRCDGVPGVDRVAVGHSDLPEGIRRFGNVYGLDTGAVYGPTTGRGFLSFVEAGSLDATVPAPGEPAMGAWTPAP